MENLEFEQPKNGYILLIFLDLGIFLQKLASHFALHFTNNVLYSLSTLVICLMEPKGLSFINVNTLSPQ
jgi:hypothetical protein